MHRSVHSTLRGVARALPELTVTLARVRLLDGESLIWSGRPSWRSMISFYLQWGIPALLPVVVIALVNRLTDVDWPIEVGIALTVVLWVVILIGGWVGDGRPGDRGYHSCRYRRHEKKPADPARAGCVQRHCIPRFVMKPHLAAPA